jgi:hypothetical protein
LNFDYTYIAFRGFLIFEPMIIVTNSLFFILSLIFYRRLSLFTHPYAGQMAMFMLLLGISSCFGAIGHAVHYQLGERFFKIVLFLMNAFSLLSIYYCFRFSLTYSDPYRDPDKRVIFAVIAWVAVLLVSSMLNGNFTLIKVHAGIVLFYCLVVHVRSIIRRANEQGSMLIIYGIIISFLSILVHTIELSLDEWFNHKDMAHVLMIISLIVIYKGARKNITHLGPDRPEAVTA